MAVSDNYSPTTGTSSDSSIKVYPTWFDEYTDINDIEISAQNNTTGDIATLSVEGFSAVVASDGGGEYVEFDNYYDPVEIDFIITRLTEKSQTFNLPPSSALNPGSLIAALDKIVKMVQESASTILSNTITSVNPFSIGNKVARAGKLLGFDSVTGEPSLVGDVDDVADISAAVAAADASATAAAASESNASTSETNAATSETNAAASAAAALVSENNAAATLASSTKNADTDLSSNGYFLDEDDFSSDDATKVASQQSIKAYVDDAVTGLTAPTRQVFTSSGTYTPPAGLKSVLVKVQAGGAGSGATRASSFSAGGGGGGGEYAEKRILAGALGGTETVTVGAGGTAGAAASGDGGTGGTSSFGSHVSAIGGSGTGTGDSGATDGDGGPGGTGGTGGDLHIDGGDGEDGHSEYDKESGSGGNSILGFGGKNQFNGNTTGTSGAGYGSGAGGAIGNNNAGAAGQPGIIIVEEYY